jgi:hypothetical protein
MATDISALPGLRQLWAETRGDPAITIALLDGPIDVTHACFQGALLTPLPTLVSGAAGTGRMSGHGTHIASMIFGRPAGGVTGIAPLCRGLIVPIYADDDARPVPQMDLARAINQAVVAGAHVINISGGELTSKAEAEPMLANAVRNCYEQGSLIVAAAGNDSCRCLHVPAALPSVLAVGAADAEGRPLESSNWGDAYQTQGVLAPGSDMLGAAPGGGLTLRTGTSFATPVVSGVIGLLLSLQRKLGAKPDPLAIREAILATAIPCDRGPNVDCLRFLVGRLNVPGARARISLTQLRSLTMPDEPTSGAGVQPGEPSQLTAASSEGQAGHVEHGSALVAVEPSGWDERPGPRVAHVPPSEPRYSARTASAVESSGSRRPGPVPARGRFGSSAPPATSAGGVIASDCSCKSSCERDFLEPVNVGTRNPIFALGVLNYDFGTEARRDSFKELMPAVHPNGLYPFFPPPPPPKGEKEKEPKIIPFDPNPYDPRQMVNYLAGYPRPRHPFPSRGGYPSPKDPMFPPEIPDEPRGYPGFTASPWDASELIWTLNIELTPIYAIRPIGGFTAEVYQRLVEFLDGQTRPPDHPDFVERVTVPGYLTGETVCLYSGQVVPVLVPNIRGMFGWNVNQLMELVQKTVKDERKKLTADQIKKRGLPADDDEAAQNAQQALRNFLDRIYYDLRNLGQTPAERAMNYAATNAFQAATVLSEQATKGMQLDCIITEPSPFCRKDSVCMDVKLRFFDPENDNRARSVSRWTVDVSDIYPVMVGPIRTWAEAGVPC